MGCASSTQVSDEDARDNPGSDMYDITINVKSPHVRLDAGKEMKTLPMQGDVYCYDMNYCYVSQRGYYPNGELGSSWTI